MDINHHWYRSKLSFLSIMLLPFSLLFYCVITLRRALYQFGLKSTTTFPVPVIIVGNITVGGTGKTPFVIWLATFLKAQGFRPGVVSRGVGGQQQIYPRKVEKLSDPAIVGDEAILLARHSECPVVIGIDRVAAAAQLIAQEKCNVIISDDGLQHYRLGRHIEIAVVDGVRRFGNEAMLPAGPLREPIKRLQEVDFVIAQQQAEPNEYLMLLEGSELISIKDHTNKITIESLENATVHGIAALGNPKRFFSALKNWGLNVIEHVFPDHYLLGRQDVTFQDNLAVIMTEKDAVKCSKFAEDYHWYLPVTAKLDERFKTALLKKIEEVKS